jgi:phosphocarrier protein FPr/phosphocarrier protein
MRGIRFALSEGSILRTQLRAMLRAVPAGQLRIMLPMIIEAQEIDEVKALVAREAADLGVSSAVQIGIMVETPAAALSAGQLARHADFFSIGTNDLSQYVLAMDRGNSALASRVDSFHPAVLRAIQLTAAGAASNNRWLGICGGLASDFRAAPLLVGLGCDELSSIPTAIPKIKQTLGCWTLSQCCDLANKALALSSAAEVRKLVSGEVK